MANPWVSVPCTANMDLRPQNAWKDLDHVQNYDSALVLIPFLRSPSPFCPQIDMKAYWNLEKREKEQTTQLLLEIALELADAVTALMFCFGA